MKTWTREAENVHRSGGGGEIVVVVVNETGARVGGVRRST